MNRRLPRLLTASLTIVNALAACGGTTRTSAGPAPAPAPAASASAGVRAGSTVPVAGRAGVDSGQPPYTGADVAFMSGMIHHHAQAVVMAGWAPSHDASDPVRRLCERIVVGQRDEIALMQRWLRERNEPVPEPDPSGMALPGMDHPMLMPGMLTPEQMAQLDRARGTEFDRLFLTGMIQHHQGAITMVDQLLESEGALRDDMIFKFAADINADQTTEINRMRLMLGALPAGGANP